MGRAERLSLSTERLVGRNGDRVGFLGPVVHAEPWQGPVSAQYVYLRQAHGAAAVACHFRCAGPREVHGAAAPDEYTAPGAGVDERSHVRGGGPRSDRKSTRLNSSHLVISYAV